MALVQYDDRDKIEYGPLILKNKEYCEKYNITYIFLKKGYESYPPWWRKVFIIRDLLNHYKSIIWVDTDACIIGKQHFDTLFSEDKHFIMSPNPPLFRITLFVHLAASFCAGVWAVKNTSQGKAILDHWCDQYNPNQWKYDGKTWIGDGTYGGHSYEQGSFQISLLNSYYSKWIERKNHWVLNYLPLPPYFYIPNDTFAVHFWKNNYLFVKDFFLRFKDKNEQKKE